LKPRTRAALFAAGVALAGVAVASALPGSSPVATFSPDPAGGSPGDTPEAATTSSTQTTMGQHSQNPPRGSVSAATGIRELRTGSNGGSSLVVGSDGAVAAVTAAIGKSLSTSGPDAFAVRYAAAFGLTSAHSLNKATTEALPGGDTVDRYQQTAGGLPVLGGQIVITSHGKQVRSAIADTSGLTPVSTKATVSAATAAETALSSAASETGLTATTLQAAKPELALYDPSLIGAPGPANLRPTWQVEITATDGSEVATVLVDALDGKARLTVSERQSVRNRVVCDLANKGVDLAIASNYACSKTTVLGIQPSTRTEGEEPVGVADVDYAYDMLGATYDFYKSNFGVDSFDGRGAQIRATVRVCYLAATVSECPYENAYWDGSQFVFGKGFVADDVVAHEYTHAITQYSSHLMYAYQPGAINEALSDIMGEFVDQQYGAGNEADPSLTWQIGEDLSIGTIRSMSNPGAYRQPRTVGGTYWYNGTADSGGVHTNSGVANYAAYLIAGGPNGIGNAKSAQLWWRVMHMLPSGAGYERLGQTLKSACSQLLGHFGFTPANCSVVSDAVEATGMWGSYYDGLGLHCDGSDSADGQPYDTIYFDGFEKPRTWPTTSDYYWLSLPSPFARYQYAAHGVGSLNGWTPNNSGNGTTATMPTAVTIPASNPSGVYLYFAQSTLDPSSTAGVNLQVSVNGGAWTGAAVLGGPATGALVQKPGYTGERVDLAPYAGKQVRFRFVLQTASNNNLLDWYVDDFTIYSCAQRPAAPTGYAYYDGTTAVVGGLTTTFIPYSPSQQIDHYEVTFSPALPGAPETIPATAPGLPVGLTVPNTDLLPRTVKVRAVTNLGTAGDWVTLSLSTTMSVLCQQAAYPLPILARKVSCTVTPLPRR
jgi:bacillolysin